MSESAEALDHLRKIAAQVPGVLYQYLLRPDGTHCLPYAAGAVREMFHVDPEEVKTDAKKIFDLIHPDDRDKLAASIRKSADELSLWKVEYRVLYPDGSVRWLSGNSAPQREPDGSILWHGFIIDVTERKLAEESLLESRQLIEKIVAAMPVRVFWKNRDLVYLGCNDAFARDAGFKAQAEVVGKDDYQMGWREQAELYREDDRQVIASGRPKMLIEEPQTTPDGSVITLLTSKIPLTNSHGEVVGVLGTYFDITERKKAEAALLSLQRLESLGALAGGIAHDFNNILTTILGNVSLLASALPPDEDPQGLLKEAESACLTAKELSNQLLTFSKGGNPVVKIEDLRPIVEQSAELAARGSNARLVFALSAEPIGAKVDRVQFARVIENLVLNAVQAMDRGGDIRVTCDAAALSAEEAKPLPEGRYARVTVQDPGAGIAAQNLPKIFEPYFSTKSAGRGLGLAVSHSIITKHGGRITAQSRPGVGTTFTLLLPLADPGAVRAAPPPPEPARIGANILVMEDDDGVAKLLQRMLERLGCRSEAVRNGEAALAAYARAQDAGSPFDAVIMDLTIAGGMGGKETIALLKTRDPGAVVIVSSGYANDPILADHAAHGFAGALNKPYLIADVAGALKLALARRRAA